MKTTMTKENLKNLQKAISQELTKLKSEFSKHPMSLEMCRKLVDVADKQVQIDSKTKKVQTIYRDMSRILKLPDRAIKDCKTILSCYDRLIKSDINNECVDKVLAEKSISQATKIISALNYCKDDDKIQYINGRISSSELYHRRGSIVLNPESLEQRAKRLKDDSEAQLTYAMITGMFKSETNGYLESLADYVSMVDTVSDKRYTRDEALSDITQAFDKVTKAITSLKEAIINKSNTIMEE